MSVQAADVWKWIDEQQTFVPQPPWRNSAQLAEAWGVTTDNAKRKANKMVKNGTLECKRHKVGGIWMTFYCPKE